jgi:hypothetical protein
MISLLRINRLLFVTQTQCAHCKEDKNLYVFCMNSMPRSVMELLLLLNLLYISVALQSLWPLAAFSVSYLYTVGRTSWTGDQPVARPLHTPTKAQTQNKCAQHPCLEWDSNPRSQRSSERRRFMPYTARAL